MSNLVVNKLSEFLSKVIKDYTKEHLNVSLLKGEIYLKDFEVDVNVINIYVEHYVPFLHVTKATVSDVKLSLPDVFHLSTKPTLIEIGHVEIECHQRDFTQPPATELVEDDEWFLAPSANPDDKDNYGLIKKVIDGCRIETDCIQLKLFLNGLPLPHDDKDQPQFHSNWFGRNVDPQKYCGPPLILDILLQNCVFQQTNHAWKCSNDLKYLRKSQGDRLKDFGVFKTFTAKSFNVTLMPHPLRINPHKKRKKKKQKQKSKDTPLHQSTAVFLLQNAVLDVKLIFQRKASDGTLKTISIETYFKKLDIFMTQNQYFDLNYWIASLLYAQAQQYAFDNPQLMANREASVSQSYSTVSQTQSQSNVQRKEATNINKEGKSNDDDEDKEAAESHLSSGKLLFDALSLCQPPRFQWNKIPIYTTVGFRIGRFSVHIMPSDWTFHSQRNPARNATDRKSSLRRKRSSSIILMQEIGSKTALGVGAIGKQIEKTAKGVGSVAKEVTSVTVKGAAHMAKGVGSIGKGIKKSVIHKKSHPPPRAPPPAVPVAHHITSSASAHTTPVPSPRDTPSPRSAKQASASSSRLRSQSHSHSHSHKHNRNEYVHKTDALRDNKYASHHGTLSESRLGDLAREFLLECHLIPVVPITQITVGDEFNYDPLISAHAYMKPLVTAILSNFSLGMIFPDYGYSIWRTRIGRSRAEQFYSVQVGDLDVFADTQLKEQLQHQLKTGFSAAVSQLRKEQEIIDAEKEKEFTPDPSASPPQTTLPTDTQSDVNLKINIAKDDANESSNAKANANATTTKGRARSQSDPKKPQNKINTEKEKSKCMTLIVSSRHYKTNTVKLKPFKFSVAQPFEGYNQSTQSVFNYQWTRRIPAPQSVLAQMSDMHIKPIVIYLDPFLVFNCVKFFAGNGVIRVYRMQAALSTFTVIFERFASRYLLDAVRIIIPINPGSTVTAAIHNLRLSSHDKLDHTVHERGLVDLSNFSSVGKHSLRTMGLGDRIVDEIHKTKDKYLEELKRESYHHGTGTHFSCHYDHRLKAAMAPGVSQILRPPDEYPWEINIGHFSLASVVHLEDHRYDNEIQVLNCRMRYVMIRSDSGLDSGDSMDFDQEIAKPFVETQISFRTDSIEGSIDTTVIDEVMSKIDFGGIAELPLPALFNKIKNKMAQKQQRQEMERKLKKERMEFKNKKQREKEEEEEEEKRLKKQQIKRQRLLKEKKETLDDAIVANDVLLSDITSHKHQDVREIEISDSEDSGDGNHNNDAGIDLDSFIEGVLDGIGAEVSSSDSDDDSEKARRRRQQTQPITPTPAHEENDEEEEEEASLRLSDHINAIEYRLMLYSNLDRGEFQITNKGNTQIKGKTRSQQMLLQWTDDILNFHFFSTELKLYDSPIGKYQEHDVVTRFSRSKDGRMWSEVVHDEPDGAIELTYPPSLERIVDKMKPSKAEEAEEAEEIHVDTLKRDKSELMALVRYITLENRVMQTRVLQLASDLSVSRDDMKRFVKQTSEDKIRIVEHQQYLVNDNMELQKQVQMLKKRIRELEKPGSSKSATRNNRHYNNMHHTHHHTRNPHTHR